MKKILSILVMVAIAISLAGCSEAEKVSYNLSEQADKAFTISIRSSNPILISDILLLLSSS